MTTLWMRTFNYGYASSDDVTYCEVNLTVFAHLFVLLQVSQARKWLLAELALVRAAFELALILALLLHMTIHVHLISLHFGCAVVRRWKADGCVRRVEFCGGKTHFLHFAQSTTRRELRKLARDGMNQFPALQTQMIINYHRGNGNLYYTS